MRSHFQLLRFLQIIVLHLTSTIFIFLALTFSRNLKSVTDAFHDFSNREFLISPWQFWNILASVNGVRKSERGEWNGLDLKQAKGFGGEKRCIREYEEETVRQTARRMKWRRQRERRQQKNNNKPFLQHTRLRNHSNAAYSRDFPSREKRKKKKLEKVTWKHETVFSILWQKKKKKKTNGKAKKSRKII